MCSVSTRLHFTRSWPANTSATSKALAIQTLAGFDRLSRASQWHPRVTLAQTLAQLQQKNLVENEITIVGASCSKIIGRRSIGIFSGIAWDRSWVLANFGMRSSLFRRLA
jgi:hypothetical protein